MVTVEFLADLEKVSLQTQVCVCAKIHKIRKMGSINFVIIHDQTGECQIVFENIKGFDFQKGDYIEVEGYLRLWETKKEIYACNCRLLGSSNLRLNPMEINYNKIQKLILKSRVMQLIYKFMESNDFLPVTSPTIVGNWVEGKTNSFEVNYFGTKKYLTLNSMLYHQVMLISGYNRIFEFSKIFRQDSSSPKDRLTEFISLDISMSNSNKFDMMFLIENMIREILKELSNHSMIKMTKDAKFGRISYFELMEKSGCKKISGAQLSAKARNYLENNYEGFVWVYGFPEEKRRFFVKSVDGTCEDYQLWFRGRHQVGSGGERETDLALMKMKIQNEGKDISNYDMILRYFESGVIPMCEIGFGFDRFLLDITESAEISDFVAFPRNGNTKF